MFNIAKWRLPFIGIGLSCLAIDQTMNINFMAGNKSDLDLILAVPIAGIASCAAFPAMGIALRYRMFGTALMLFLAFFFFALFSLGASIDRAGSGLDDKINQAKANNKPEQLAKAAYQRSLLDLDKAKQLAIAECSTGRGKKCREREQEVNTTEAKVELYQGKLVNASKPQKSVNAMADRVSRILDITARDVNNFFPLLLPFGLWLGSIAFCSVGFAPVQRLPDGESSPKNEAPIEIQIIQFLNEGGKGIEAAEKFNKSPSTISRIRNKYADLKVAG